MAAVVLLEGRWREWGFLRWKERFFRLDSAGQISIWKASGPEGEPSFSLQSCTLAVDEENATRFTLDDGSALYQLKADDGPARDAFVAALRSISITAADVLRQRQMGRQYPERVGAYALGSLLGQGGFAKVKSGIVWESGERIAAKIMPAKIAKDPQHMKEIVAMGRR